MCQLKDIWKSYLTEGSIPSFSIFLLKQKESQMKNWIMDENKMKVWMIDVEDFCDKYPIYRNGKYGGMNGFTIDSIAMDVEMFFYSSEAADYAKQYLTEEGYTE
jgi:hypothetical protein